MEYTNPPIHLIMQKYKIVYPDGTSTYLNKLLLIKQKVSDENLELLKHAHIYKFNLYTEMGAADSPAEFKVIAKKITDVEYYMQELWGFPKDIKMHRFWELPHCNCAKIDNEERYGTGIYIYSKNCPIHSI